MSKPATPKDVEDVLSSIRRLVSEDARSARGREMPGHGLPSAPEGQVPPRLVLTESLRVSEPSGAAPEPAPAPEPEGERIEDWAGIWGFTAANGPAVPEPEPADGAAPDEAAVLYDAGGPEAAEDRPALREEAEPASAGAEQVAGAPADRSVDVEDDEGDEDGPALFDDAEEPGLIDEETLRIMVTEIVRRELMGELGDRITRNVRKLVRREIQRALAARELQ